MPVSLSSPPPAAATRPPALCRGSFSPDASAPRLSRPPRHTLQDGAVIGKRCATCPRGVFASRQLKRGDVILRIPLSLALPTTTQDTPDGRAPVAAEMARDLLIRMHTDPSFNATWGPYWASLPPPDETFGAEMMSRAHLDMLQHPQLVLSAQQRQAEAAQVFDGSYKGGIYPPLASVVGTGVVSLDTFKWVITLFNSRAFGLEAGSFLPLADLLNHASDANVDKLLGECFMTRGESLLLGRCRDGRALLPRRQ